MTSAEASTVKEWVENIFARCREVDADPDESRAVREADYAARSDVCRRVLAEAKYSKAQVARWGGVSPQAMTKILKRKVK